MEQKRVLIVDDEQDLCEILQFNLIAAGYEADVAYSAEEALDRLSSIHPQASHPFDLLLLDVMMPRLSGFELAERLKADEQTAQLPIIFLTAKDTEEDTLQGFSLGADDYVTKPFSVREVMARVKAVLGRKPAPLAYEGLVINAANKTVVIDGQAVALTRTEYELLQLLVSHHGQVFSRQQLLESVWPQNVIVTERTVDVNIARLRKKLGRYAACLVSRTRFGYTFEVKE
jgi:DNA-binding response OmpR family regulator